MISSMAQHGAILMKYYELASWSPHAFVGYKNNCHPLKEKCPQQLMNTNNFAQAIIITLWIYLILLSILMHLETGRIITRLLSLLALDILLAVWSLTYQKRN